LSSSTSTGSGQPPEFRGIAADRGRDELTAAFEAYLSRRSYALDKLRRKIGERPTALLCYLQGEGACEGAVLVQLLQRQGSVIQDL
jgi:hypothetical protein